MLTEKEVTILHDALKTYPDGVGSNSWGYGEMDYPEMEPEDFTLRQLQEFG